jgi:hypothetical protein
MLLGRFDNCLFKFCPSGLDASLKLECSLTCEFDLGGAQRIAMAEHSNFCDVHENASVLRNSSEFTRVSHGFVALPSRPSKVLCVVLGELY